MVMVVVIVELVVGGGDGGWWLSCCLSSLPLTNGRQTGRGLEGIDYVQRHLQLFQLIITPAIKLINYHTCKQYNYLLYLPYSLYIETPVDCYELILITTPEYTKSNHVTPPV